MVRSVFRLLGMVLCAVLLCQSPLWAVTDAEVEAARQKGIQFLLDSQQEDGSWVFEKHEVGITSLSAIALIENGILITDPLIEKAERYVRSNYLETTGTYDIALAILFLSRLGDPDNRSVIRDLAARLIAGQNVEGGWGYTCPKVRSSVLSGTAKLPDPMAGVGDNSCTQFAVLGLWVASRSNVDIDATMQLVARRFAKTQNEDGGWTYNPFKAPVADAAGGEVPADGTPDPMKKPVAQPSSSTMTFAGLFCVTVARATQIRAAKEGRTVRRPSTTRPKPGASTDDTAEPEVPFVDPGADAKTLKDDPVFQKGLSKATAFAPGVSNAGARYFLWSVERMGVILGMNKFGTTDWFDVGAGALLKIQAENGSWEHATWGANADTAFAILFLRKANLGSDITRLLEGEPELPVQISTKADGPRFLTIEEAVKASKPGDTIRIEGSGPFQMPHLDVNHDLTIQAGLGYTPILVYDLGFDASGLRSNPKSDPNARHMIRVTNGTLNLEGLQLQMDGPRTVKDVAWNAVVAQGGRLRILNCSISEGSREGMAAVQITGPAEVEILNSQLIGGRAAIEFSAAGEQSVSVQNSILFSDTLVRIVQGTKPGEKVSIQLSHVAAQGREAFNFAKVTTPTDITSNGVAYYCDSMGLSMLPTPRGHEGISWTGNSNVYDVRSWIGSGGSAVASVKDATTWNTFWDGNDIDGDKRIITYDGKLRQGAYSHTVTSDKFSFSSTSQAYGLRKKCGIVPQYVGPGYSYSVFREGFDYTSWTRGLATAN
ncbi:MAG: prenyltransferase/squalene oxidase repeat-containing protein [Planctomycetaceae bacterium]